MPRLGQLLVRADLVSENNLARALGVQHFAGGRIGTLLLERGSVSEDDLGKTLAQQHGVEYVSWKLLADVSPIVIAALPAKFAIKHAAVPYDRSESAIKLALRDPADLRILDELFFVTGRKIIAGVAPEVRIYQALEKYYGERRTPRYAILAEKLSRPARGTRGSSSPPPPPKFFPEPERPLRPLPEAQEIWGDAGDADITAGTPIIQSWKLPDQQGGWAGTSSVRSPRVSGEVEPISWEEMPPSPSLWTQESPTPAAEGEPAPEPEPELPAAAEPPPVPPAIATQAVARPAIAEAPPIPAPTAREALPPAAPAPEIAEASQAAQAAVPPAPSAPLPPPLMTPLAPPLPSSRSAASPGSAPAIATVRDFPDVAAASDRDAIGAAVLSSLSVRFPAAALFAARPDGVAGWASSGKVDFDIIRRIVIPWSDPSVFLNVRLSRSFYLGPLLELPHHRELADAFGGTWPEEIAVQPILIKERPLAFLVVQALSEGITPLDLVYLRELAQAAAGAFAAAIRLKKKEI